MRVFECFAETVDYLKKKNHAFVLIQT